jgi:DNA-binding MarR family transcriptional regulator
MSRVSTQDTLQVVIAMHRLLRSLRRESDAGGVHPTQLIVLALLNQHGPLRIGELADRVPCSQPTATTAVAGLETAGYVRREQDPTDGRASRIVVTEVGRRTLESRAHSEAEILADRLSTVGEEDLRILCAAAPILSALADHPTVHSGQLTTGAPGGE